MRKSLVLTVLISLGAIPASAQCKSPLVPLLVQVGEGGVVTYQQPTPAPVPVPLTKSAEVCLDATEQITLTASSSTHLFIGWGGVCTGNVPQCTIYIKDPKTLVSATFQRPRLQVTIDQGSMNFGSVVSSPAGINCGVGNTICGAEFPLGTQVIAKAVPADGYMWQAWSDVEGLLQPKDRTIVMDRDRTIVTSFAPQLILTAPVPVPVVVTTSLAASVIGAGTITSRNASGILCPTQCQSLFPIDSEVTLEATPAATSYFDSWQNCPSASGNRCTAVVRVGAPAVVATFKRPKIFVTFRGPTGTVLGSNPSGLRCDITTTGQVASCNAEFDFNQRVRLQMDDYRSLPTVFNWGVPGCVETSNSCYVTASAPTQNLTISFSEH